MLLRDHFHPPLSTARSWESFHSRWADSIGDALNRLLPRRYFTEILTHLGNQVAADVAEMEGIEVDNGEELANGPVDGSGGGVAVQAYAPPVATLTMPATFPDELEVRVHDERDCARLVAVVELVSPRNKDRVDARRGFAGKCAAYLQRGIGLVVVDVVTGRHFNLHDELVGLLGLAEPFLMPADAALYAAAYRPVRRGEADLIDLWPAPLELGGPLPTLPLALRGGRPIPLDLNATYHDACVRSRL
jgi:hypothetical protein